MIETIGVILFWTVVAVLVAVGSTALAIGLLVLINFRGMQ